MNEDIEKFSWRRKQPEQPAQTGYTNDQKLMISVFSTGRGVTERQAQRWLYQNNWKLPQSLMMEYNRLAQHDAMTNKSIIKWQDILKKKPFKGYNKKIHARTGGLSAKGRAKFKREQGSNLKPPVTTKPSKLKQGSKAAKRRKSFCARSRGFKRDDGTYSEKAKAARRRWNC